jgi:signal transduction histidine kinase
MLFAESDTEKVGLAPGTAPPETVGASRSPVQSGSVDRLFGQSRNVFLLEPVVSLMITAALWNFVSARQASLWLVLVWVAAVLRGLLSEHIAKADPNDEQLEEWSLATAVATGLTGAIWASGLLLMWPQGSAPHAVLLVAAIAVVSGVVMASIARYTPAAVIYLLLTLPVGFLCVILNQRAEPFIVLSLTAILGAGMVYVASNTRRLCAEQSRLRLELDTATEAAAAAQRAKTEFIANMSHELRTPLNAINGFSEIIKDQAYGPLGDEKYQSYAQDIHDSGTRLLEVVNDILEMSKLETGDMALDEQILNVDSAIQSALNLIRESAEKAGVTIGVVDSPDRPRKIIVDPQLLKQILTNLLSNAVKFTPLGGEVLVETKYSANRDFVLIVRDNGIGMAAEEIPIALAPFGQADATLSRRFEGTGLGLPLVNALVQLHGGELRLESEPNAGTTAVVTFPSSCIHS